MKSLEFDVIGVTDRASGNSIRRALNRLDGIAYAEMRLDSGVATVIADPTALTPEAIESAIRGLGYPAKARPSETAPQRRCWTRR